MQNPFDPDKIYLKSKQTKPKFQATKIPTQIPNPPKQDYILQKYNSIKEKYYIYYLILLNCLCKKYIFIFLFIYMQNHIIN